MNFYHLHHACQFVPADRFRHAAGASVAITGKRPDRPSQSCALFVSFAGHDCSDRAAEGPAFETVITKTIAHYERPEVRVAESKCAENVRVFRGFFDRIT